MTLAAAGTIAIAGIALTGTDASAVTEPPAAVQQIDREVVLIGDGDAELDGPAWFDGDSCPPCGMG